jgi:transcriptional regulator with XRE-family HTH domain
MSPAQYRAARRALGFTHEQLAKVIGKSTRQVFRYQERGVESETAARLIRLLVRMKLTVSARNFEELVSELQGLPPSRQIDLFESHPVHVRRRIQF